MRILGIAINDYDDKELGNLNNPEKDINDIIHILTSKYYFEDVDFVLGKEKTTRKNLYSLLQNYITNALEGDNLLIVFAGHGKFDDRFGTTYWLPSDADEKDPSSWFNLNDVLAFIRVSKASHISIISDSCFAGGIFESKLRGGGMQVFEDRISREALTSGGIENVSDGKKTENSPFAKDLIKILAENYDRYFPFFSLSQKLILEFEKTRKQTPQYGSLNNVGHNGGSLIFKLQENISELKEKPSLAQLLGNLYINSKTYTEDNIRVLKNLWEEKNKVVRAQKYDEAARLRDTEKSLLGEIFKAFEISLNEIRNSVKLNNDDQKKINELNSAIDAHLKEVEEEKEQYEKTISLESKKDIITALGMTAPQSLELSRTEISQYIKELFSSDFDNPATKHFNELRNELLSNYKKNVMDLYAYFVKRTFQVNSEIIEKKNKSIVEQLKEIYAFQISYLTTDGISELRKELKLSEFNLNFLKWIDNTEN